jgi:hypothetical protein
MKLTDLVSDVHVMSVGDTLFGITNDKSQNWEHSIPDRGSANKNTWVAWFALYYKKKWANQA